MTDEGPEEVDVRAAPRRYEIGEGAEGAFHYQPYKDELLAVWTVGDLADARPAAEQVYLRFLSYLAAGEFPGADMARKYLRMGFTRAMRYAKYPGGQKYEDGEQREPQQWYDPEKRAIAQVYRHYWDRAREDDRYRQLRERHREESG